MRSPEMTQKEYERKIDAITKCGANRGPHDYMPISWSMTKDCKAITMLMCRVCMNRVSLETLAQHFPQLVI